MIDGSDNSIDASITFFPSPPHFLSVNEVTGRLYATLPSSDELGVIDGNTNELIDKVTVGDEPSGVAVDSATNTIYVGNFMFNVTVVDGATHEIVQTLLSGFTTDVAVNPLTHRLYVANNGHVDVWDTRTSEFIWSHDTPGWPTKLDVGVLKNEVWVSNDESALGSFTGSVSSLDEATNSLMGTISTGLPPLGIDARSGKTYVAHVGESRVSVQLPQHHRFRSWP